MKRYLLVPLFAAAAGSAAAQAPTTDTLVDPGWNDAFFAPYVAQPRDDAAFTANSVTFSLPVLGFPDAGPGGLAEPLGERLRASLSQWPACASPQPEVVTVPANATQSAGLEPGSWFASTYDFGCLQIVIEGDRNPPDAALVPERDALPESGTIVISRQDENAGYSIDEAGRALMIPGENQPLGEVLIAYTRGNLTYGITVSCGPESGAFCSDNGGLRALVGELVPIAGRPQP